MEKIKLVFTEYLSLVFVGLAILLFFFEPSKNAFTMGTGMGTWNLNQQIGGGGLLDNSILTFQMLIWMSMHISIVTYTIVRFKKKKTAFLGGLLHTGLVVSYLLMPQFWFAFDWFYPTIHFVCLCLNVMYAFFVHVDKLSNTEDILDA